MSATAAQALGWRATRVRQFTGGAGSWFEYLAEEFAARPRRLMRAVRLALLTSLGIGVMAAAHVESILGPYLLWAIAAAPRPMMTPREAIRLIVTQGVLLALAVPLAGLLAEVPWFHLPCFALFVAGWAYLVRRKNLSNAWMLIGITVIDSFYAVIFDPRGFGWDAASTFGGAVIALGMILLFDAWLWPDPADAALLASLAHDLERTRQRLGVVRRGYLDPGMGEGVPSPPAISELPSHLTLLDRVDREGASAREKSQLLTIITVNERLHLELGRLLVVAREPVPAGHRLLLRAEIERVIDAIDAALGGLHEHVRSGSTEGYAPPAPLLEAMTAAFAALDARSASLQLHRAPSVDPRELSNMSAFFVGLRRMARLLERSAEYPHLAVDTQTVRPRPFYDPETARYALKLAVATMAMLVIALASQSAEMTAALWTVLIAGLPTHGATLRKMTLRLAGVLVGGAIALAMIVVVTPNFETVLTYMIVCFVVLLACAWTAQSSSRFAYAGSQMGTTFVLVFAGLSPSEQVYEPLWRTWGVILGIIVTAVVFILVWPAYAGDAMLPRLKRLLHLNLELIPSRGAALDDADIDALQAESTDRLSELLGVADDARLEGAHSGVNPEGMVDAAGSLRRIAHRLGSIAAGRAQQRALSTGTEQARRAFEDALARRLSAWVDYFDAGRPFDRRVSQAILAAHRGDALERTLDDFGRRVAASSYQEIAAWPLEARRSLLAEVDSFHRVVLLTGELDQQFATIPA